MTVLFCFQTCMLAACIINSGSASVSSCEAAPHECLKSESDSLLHDVIDAGEVLLQVGMQFLGETPEATVNVSHDSAIAAEQNPRRTKTQMSMPGNAAHTKLEQDKSDLASKSKVLEPTLSAVQAQMQVEVASNSSDAVQLMVLGVVLFVALVAAFTGLMHLIKTPDSDQAGNKVAEEKAEVTPLKVYSSMVALVSVAVFKTQITALLFSSSNYPTAFSLMSCVVTCIMLMPVFAVFPSQWQVANFSIIFPDLLIVVAFTALDLGFANIALAELSTALYQIIAACNPAMTAFIETIYMRKVQHWAVYVTVLGLVLGAAFATMGSTGIDRYSTYGLIAALIQVTTSASKYVFAHGILKKHKGALSSLSLLFWLDFFMIPIFIPWTMLNGEFAALLVVETHSGAEWMNMIFTSGVGGVRALSQFIVLTYVSATSMSAANIFTQILNILISLPIQHTPLTQNLVIGILFTLTASDRKSVV